MKLLLLFLVTLCFVSGLKSQDNDSLVYIADLEFNNEKEKNAYLKTAQNDYSSIFELFYSIVSPNQNNLQCIKGAFYSQIGKMSEKLPRRNQEKKIRNIYKTIHSEYFRKYESSCYFNEIFEKGTYNCVTASVLFGLTFEVLKIPFEIRLSENHAYVVAYPQTLSVMVETTNPTEGFTSYDQGFKIGYVKYLRDSKIISDNEYATSSVNELFNQHYFKEESINLKSLAGVQYFNLGVGFLNKRDYRNAFKQFEKAWILFPSERVVYVLLNSIYAILADSDYNDIEDVSFIYKLARYKKFGVPDESILSEFVKITHKQLINNSNEVFYDKVYKTLTKKLPDKEIVKRISYIYNYEKGRFLYNKSRFSEALEFCQKAYDENPDNADAQLLLIYCISNKVIAVPESEKAIELLENYANRYPRLAKNLQFNQLLLSYYLDAMRLYFESNKIKEAIKYKTLFENSFITNGEYTQLHQFIGVAYSASAVYYFKKGKYKTARITLEQGLEFSPQNYELKKRMEILNQY